MRKSKKPGTSTKPYSKGYTAKYKYNSPEEWGTKEKKLPVKKSKDRDW
jgi:hypothetical protein